MNQALSSLPPSVWNSFAPSLLSLTYMDNYPRFEASEHPMLEVLPQFVKKTSLFDFLEAFVIECKIIMIERGNKTPEQQEPLKRLFRDYGELAILHGEIDDSPRDPSLPVGLDGTIDTEGVRQRSFRIHVDPSSMPPPLAERSIYDFTITYAPSVVLDDAPTDDTVLLITYESAFETLYELKRPSEADDTVVSDVLVSLNDEPDDSALDKLDIEAASQTALAVALGDTDVLKEEGDRGDLARNVHYTLNAPPRPMNSDEIALFEEAYPYLKNAPRIQ